MNQVNIGIVGLCTVGSGTLTILVENAGKIAEKLGFRLHVRALCDLLVDTKTLPAMPEPVLKTKNWRELVTHPEVQIVVELVGGTTIARQVIDTAIA